MAGLPRMAAAWMAAAAALAAGAHAACELRVEAGRLMVGGEPWADFGRPCARADGAEHCAESFGQLAAGWREDGSDPIGSFKRTATSLPLGSSGASWEVALREYSSEGHTLVFEQNFLDALNHTSAPGNSVYQSGAKGMASWGPSIKVQDHRGKLGILRYDGPFAGSYFHLEPFHPGMKVVDALTQGPIALFSQECAVIMSPASQFMSSSNFFDPVKTELGFGVMGSVTSIPAGHSTSTIFSSWALDGEPDGIRRAFKSWGNKLLRLFGTRRTADVTLENLQFSTDNGAYYYYLTEKNKSYQDTIIDVQRRTAAAGIPFRQWLMDSWWYFKGVGDGVKNWTAMPNIFPDGIAAVKEATNWDIVAHNRYWSSNTDYASQNGGEYDFAVEDALALPLEQRFWDDLLREAKGWGLTTYEQDWLYNQFRGMNITLQTVDVARMWLMQMGTAAKKNDMHVQYCMSWPRHVLQSLEIDAVSQIRASDDYWPNNENWAPVGVSSMFVHALGLTPTKDNFWTSNVAENNPRYGHRAETASRLHGLVSSWSTGPVAPSDRVDLLDRVLILRSCSTSGKLLRPDVPAARTDASLMAKAGIKVTSELREEVWFTHVTLSGFRFLYVLSAHAPALELTAADLKLDKNSAGSYVAWPIGDAFKTHALPLQFPATNKANFVAYGLAPTLPNGWVFFGEAETKWVPVSRDRFSNLVVTDQFMKVTVRGEAHERVNLVLQCPKGKIHYVDCVLSSVGDAIFSTASMQCGAGDVALSA